MFKNNSYHCFFFHLYFYKSIYIPLHPKHHGVLIINTLHNFIWFYTNKPDHLRRCEAICKV